MGAVSVVEITGGASGGAPSTPNTGADGNANGSIDMARWTPVNENVGMATVGARLATADRYVVLASRAASAALASVSP